MSDQLTKSGLYFDEHNKIRILDPLVAASSIELKTECEEFMESVNQFKKIADGFITMIDSLAQEVEREKMKAIGARNLVHSISKKRDAQQQQLKELIYEKSTELERLRIYYQSLLKIEAEQQERIDFLTLNL